MNQIDLVIPVLKDLANELESVHGSVKTAEVVRKAIDLIDNTVHLSLEDA